MCKVIGISRTVYYYEKRIKFIQYEIEHAIIDIFNTNQKVYGARKIKQELKKLGFLVSRRRIARIMRKYGLKSVYIVKKYRVTKTACNESKIDNVVNRKFDNRDDLEVVVSDLTYVNVAGNWNYICTVVNLHNREILGWSIGRHKTVNLVYQAFLSIKPGLHKISIFHSDRGSEFKNELIENLIKTFGIKRSLSRKGNPFDNAVSEATFKIIKTEFVRRKVFSNIESLRTDFFDYVNWFNNFRIHSTLGFKRPAEFRQLSA